MHLVPSYPSVLRDILSRTTRLPVHWAEPGEELEPGRVYVAPPAVHSVFDEAGNLARDESAPVHFVRPSADTLLASCAEAYGAGAVAVVLTGTGVDGAAGAAAVKAAGGTVIAQDEATSQHFGMPHAAIDTGAVDLVLPLEAIAGELVRLTAAEVA
jgi:two-component system chemotaxis response regulator CheB